MALHNATPVHTERPASSCKEQFCGTSRTRPNARVLAPTSTYVHEGGRADGHLYASGERRQLQPSGQATRRYSPGTLVTLQSGNIGKTPSTLHGDFRDARIVDALVGDWPYGRAPAVHS